MKLTLDIWKWLASLAALLLASACGHDDVLPPDVYVEPTTPYVEVRIAIPVANPTGTRANPMGGEEGNGRERGILNEDKIHDINIFFFADVNGMNGNDNTKIEGQLYYNLDQPSDSQNSELVISAAEEGETDNNFEKNYITLKFKYWGNDVSNADGLNFLAVANVGPMQKIDKLGDLRNYDLSADHTNAWNTTYDPFSKDASKVDYFLMSTAYADNYTSGCLATGTNKISKGSSDFIGTTTLQRLYARLDLWYNKEKNAVTSVIDDKDGKKEVVTELKYSIPGTVDTDDSEGSIVYLTDVLPVNVMKTPSFLFKKVTDGMSDFGSSNFTLTTSFKWGGKESPAEGPFSGDNYNDLPTNYVLERHTHEKTADGKGGSYNSWYGNTAVNKVKNDIKEEGKGSFSLYYHSDRERTSYDPNTDSDHISIIGYANENTHPIDCFHSNYLTGLAFRAIYVPKAIYKYDASEVDDDGLVEVTAIPGDNPTIYRYSPTTKEQKESESLYFDCYESMDAYLKAHPEDMAIWTPFTPEMHDGKWGFVCYYNLWLRHYNNEAADPQATYPMEYATVRNNIYRVSVSFTGPGDPSPTMREPDTMKARIFVRKWNYREEDTFYFD